jgi:biopolymer transport protein ExbB/TolQ
MTPSQPAADNARRPAPPSPGPRPAAGAAANPHARPQITAWAFIIGVPFAVLLLAPIHLVHHLAPQYDTPIYRYVSHNVECVEVLLFCCALGALAAKMWQTLTERRACATAVVPEWDGRAVPVSEAPNLLAALRRLPARLQATYLGQRVVAVLEFLCQRRSATELDDHLRTIADNDQMALEGSYALTRFITWAIPILGFLGTVLGITGAISGATPEKLEHDLSQITDGLALAFDATALALALTMVVMFVSFLVERREQAILEEVDRIVERQLAHRFQRLGADSGPFIDAVRQNAQVLLDATGQLVQRQADLWARALADADRRGADTFARQQEQVGAALEAALERTLQTHVQRLTALEKQSVDAGARLFEQVAGLAAAVRDTGREQQAALVHVAEGVAAQAGALTRLQEGEKDLLRLQGALQQNLAALAAASSFDQVLHNLTAAVHLLTARAGALAFARAPEPAGRATTGKAA